MKVTKKILFLFLLLGASSFAACAPAVDSETHWQNSAPDENGVNSEDQDAGFGDSEEDADIADSGPLPDPGDAGEEEPPPELMVLPEELVFEDVAIGTQETLSVEVTNTGDQVLSIIGAEISEGFSVGESSVDLEPGEAHSLEVIFSPTEVGAYLGRLEIHWMGDEEQTIEVEVSGNLPCLELSPEALIFGELAVGESEIQTLTLINCASVTAMTVDLRLEHDPSMEESTFFLVEEESYPQGLEAGASLEVAIEYVGEDISLAQGTLYVELDPMVAAVEVSLVGQVAPDDGN